MIPRYSRAEMADIWSPASKFRIWFEIEAHAAMALAGLDAYAQSILREVLVDFRSHQDPTFLVVTSDFTIAQALAEDAMVFASGKLVERGSIAHLVHAPKHDATKALIAAVTLPSLSPDALSPGEASI